MIMGIREAHPWMALRKQHTSWGEDWGGDNTAVGGVGGSNTVTTTVNHPPPTYFYSLIFPFLKPKSFSCTKSYLVTYHSYNPGTSKLGFVEYSDAHMYFCNSSLYVFGLFYVLMFRPLSQSLTQHRKSQGQREPGLAKH